MMHIDNVVELFPDLARDELSDWVQRHWVQPDTNEQGDAPDEVWVFTEIDVARVRLIYVLRRDLDIAEDTVPMMLALLDQIYELRRTIKTINRAIAEQPDSVRAAIRAAMRGD